jgi:hypothetical protein
MFPVANFRYECVVTVQIEELILGQCTMGKSHDDMPEEDGKIRKTKSNAIKIVKEANKRNMRVRFLFVVPDTEKFVLSQNQRSWSRTDMSLEVVVMDPRMMIPKDAKRRVEEEASQDGQA